MLNWESEMSADSGWVSGGRTAEGGGGHTEELVGVDALQDFDFLDLLFGRHGQSLDRGFGVYLSLCCIVSASVVYLSLYYIVLYLYRIVPVCLYRVAEGWCLAGLFRAAPISAGSG